jgi:UDP-N-acetylmuramyl pentapeptide phosphotransferase/UDP-N-acetylglucosamine-1-phosphate transferase
MSFAGLDQWALALAVGFLASRLLALAAGAGGLLAAPVLQRQNYRDVPVPTAAGVLLVLAVLFVEAGRAVIGAIGIGAEPGLDVPRSLVLFAALGFGLLGLVDDVIGGADARGFRGHVGEALRGRLTTGFAKLAGGGALAVVLVASPGFVTGRRLVIDAVLIALCANLGNLLDRAPGRVTKVSLLAYVPLALVLGGGPTGVALAVVMGAALGLLGDDLREHLMLGDTGANVLGGVLGLAVVLGCGDTVRYVVLAMVVALNVASEFVSFSAVIARVAPLRALDALGRRRDL